MDLTRPTKSLKSASVTFTLVTTGRVQGWTGWTMLEAAVSMALDADTAANREADVGMARDECV